MNGVDSEVSIEIIVIFIAVNRVITIVSVDKIVPDISVDRVVSSLPINLVVTGTAVDQIVARSSDENDRAEDAIIAEDNVVARIAINSVARAAISVQRGSAANDPVVVVATIDGVTIRATFDVIIAGITIDGVESGGAVDAVVTAPAAELVIAGFTVDLVLAAVAQDLVIANATVDDIVICATRDDVIAIVARDKIEARFRKDMIDTVVAMNGIVACAAAQEVLIYDNTVNFSGNFFLNGGATNQSGNTITRLVADDITPIGGFSGQAVSNVYFSVWNNNSGAVLARPRLRMWNGDGAGGIPGTLIAAFSFNPISFPAGGSGFFFHPTGVNVPSGTFWMGLTFDDNTGATGATATQLNNLGMALDSPPVIGTSADLAFETTAAGSFAANSPAGSTFNFNGNPPANFYFGMSVQAVPEPSVSLVLGFGTLLLFLFRRTKKC